MLNKLDAYNVSIYNVKLAIATLEAEANSSSVRNAKIKAATKKIIDDELNKLETLRSYDSGAYITR